MSFHLSLRCPRLLLFAVVCGASLAALAILALPSVAMATAVERVSVSSAEAQGNGDSLEASISQDGRYVVFTSAASNLVTGDTNGRTDVFLRDRVSGVTTRVSVSSAEAQGNGDSFDPSITPDGRFVLFHSLATNLVANDTNSCGDVFVRDLSAGSTFRVSVSTGGAQANQDCAIGAISADGRYVAFQTEAANLVSGDTNDTWDVFLRDRVNNTTVRVSLTSGGAQANSDSGMASLSADGRYVAFQSAASNLVSGDLPGTYDVFVRDRTTGVTSLVSVSLGGVPAGGGQPVISPDGRYVAFQSSSNLVAGDTNGKPDVFVRDRTAGTTTMVSLSSSGAQGNGQSTSFSPFVCPAISADARYVAFAASSTNLVSGDTNAKLDIFLRDRTAGSTLRVSATAGGTQGNGDSDAPAVSADGCYVAFESASTNLVTGDTNSATDVFVVCPSPRVTSVAPVFGTSLGGNSVIITGTGFSRVTGVTFGGTAASSFTMDSATKITAVCPPRSAGKVDVVVTAAGGASAATGTGNDYTYLARNEQNDARLFYSGAWSTYQTSGPSAGSYARANTSGAYVVIPFSGTRLDLIATRGTTLGKADVSVDGGSPVVIDLAATTVAYQQRVFSTGNLTAGYHSVRISWNTSNTAGKYISIDAVEVGGFLLSRTRFEEGSSLLVYAGSWSAVSDPSASLTAYKITNVGSSLVTITFNGISLDLICAKGPGYGRIFVTLDGRAPVLVDLYNSGAQWQQKVWSTGFMAPGNHTVIVTRAGQKNTYSTGYVVNLDAVDVRGILK